MTGHARRHVRFFATTTVYRLGSGNCARIGHGQRRCWQPFKVNREIAQVFRFYEIETRFYEQIAEEIELRTPKRYYSDINLDSGDFILLLEDLAPAKVADQIAGLSQDQVKLATRELAKFHSTWWEDPRLDEYDWMWSIDDPVRAATSQQSYQQAWGPFVESFGKVVPPEILALGERFGEKMIDISNSRPPNTHGRSHGNQTSKDAGTPI